MSGILYRDPPKRRHTCAPPRPARLFGGHPCTIEEGDYWMCECRRVFRAVSQWRAPHDLTWRRVGRIERAQLRRRGLPK